MKETIRQISVLFVLSLFLLFVACSSAGDDVKKFIQTTKTRKPKPVKPLPEFKSFEPYKYSAQELRSPFEPFVTTIAVKLPPAPIGKGPDLNRRRELLESYPLDSLRMVGTIERAQTLYALIRDRQGIVHRVNVGNYMGQNYGKIQKITDSHIELREWAVTNQGNYEERTVIIHLSP